MSTYSSTCTQSFSCKESFPAQQSYQPGVGEMTTTSHSQKDRSLLRRSLTSEEGANVQTDIGNGSAPFSQSDCSALIGWQSTRQVTNQHVPQSVPNCPNSAFHPPTGEGTSGSYYYARRQQVSRRKPLLRAETISHGLGTNSPVRVPECNICMEDFKEDGPRVPRLLTCGHSYCTSCLEKMLSRVSASCPVINCPKCNNETSVQDRDVIKLRKNYDLLDAIVTMSVPSGASASSDTPDNIESNREFSPVEIKCVEHGDHLSSYCKKCGLLVCSSCLVFGSHRDHANKTLFVSQAATEYREQFQKIYPEVRKQKNKMESVLVEVEAMTVNVQETGGKLMDETDSAYNNLIKVIQEKRDALKLEIMERTQIRLEALNGQSLELQECIEKAEAVYHITEVLLQSDDYTLLQRANLTMDEIEGVFVRPPPSIPRAQNDLVCEFPDSPKEEIISHLNGYGTVRPDVGTIRPVYVKSYHDGFGIQWDGHNFADNQGTTYYLQKAIGEDENFTKLSRGSSTKFNYREKLEDGVTYRFRVQVRTTEGVGLWSEPTSAIKAPPDFCWHDSRRNVKIDLSKDKLEAYLTKGGSHNHWTSFAGDKQFMKGRQYYFEIKILDLGKGKPLKNLKLAFGILSCSKSKVGSFPWQDGKLPVGQFDAHSWAFQPGMGTINSHDTQPEGVKFVAGIDLENGDYLGMLVDLDEKKLVYFINGNELGVAFDDVDADSVFPVVSIRDKVRIRLRFPPPPYSKRSIHLIRLLSRNSILSV